MFSATPSLPSRSELSAYLREARANITKLSSWDEIYDTLQTAEKWSNQIRLQSGENYAWRLNCAEERILRRALRRVS